MSKGLVLVIEDEPDMLDNCRRILERAGYACRLEQDSAKARAELPEISPDVVITDLVMPGVDGMGILEAARGLDPDLPVIMFTAFATVDSAVEAIRKGAFDYIAKPFTSGQLVVAVDRAVNQLRLLRENRRLSLLVGDAQELDNIVGLSPPMQELRLAIRKVAEGDASVLISGESGTGKELAAKAIHLVSPRRQRSFVPVDCVALPDTLLEAELFGHEKGAFTGAHLAKPGLIEIADGGTLFLDEVSRIPPATQAKLLRVLQEREFRRLGSNRTIKADFRVLAATNEDLEKLIREGSFRDDLYYRLNVIQLRLPPLRDRPGDVPLLAAHFFNKYRSEAPRVKGIAAPALEALAAYPWPGNVRELENAVRRAMAMAEGENAILADFPFLAPGKRPRVRADAAEPFKEARKKAMDEFEKDYLVELLRTHHGNISAAAQDSGIDRRTIHRLINKHGIATKPGR